MGRHARAAARGSPAPVLGALVAAMLAGGSQARAGTRCDLEPVQAEAPRWRPCEDRERGCLELEVSRRARIYGVRGSGGPTPRIALGSDGVPGGRRLEIIAPTDPTRTALRLDSPAGLRGCLFDVVALDSDRALIAVITPDDRAPRSHLALLDLDSGATRRLERSPSPLEAAIRGNVRALTRTRRDLSVETGGRSVLAPVPAHLTGLVSELTIARGAIWLVERRPRERTVWRVERGAPSRVAAGAGALASDGIDVVFWRRRGGRLALEQAGSRAPIRTIAGDAFPAAGVVGDGRAAYLEPVGARHRLVVTRLADGARWTVPERAGRRWGPPLYITGQELAVVELAGAGAATRGRAHTIVRLRLDSTGGSAHVPRPK